MVMAREPLGYLPSLGEDFLAGAAIGRKKDNPFGTYTATT